MSTRNAASQRVASTKPSIFSVISELAAKAGAVNLGQGFPDFDGPDVLKEVVREALHAGRNQYAPSTGVKELREAVAAHQARKYGLQWDPDRDVVVTCGATEALYASVLALVDPGDEVVVFEPFYDSYVPAVEAAGGGCRFVQLRPPDAGHAAWWFDEAEFAAAFGPKTRLLLLNTPHNPTGKVFTRGELASIAAHVQRWDVRVVADEVYEHLAYAPAVHVPMATLPGMADRTLTVGSAGKTFSFTGWKVGWASGPAELRNALQAVHQFTTFCTPAPFQLAAAAGLGFPQAWFADFTSAYQRRRDRLAAILGRAGLSCFPTEGSYFLLADLAAAGFNDDAAFSRCLIQEVGVASIPVSALFADPARPEARRYARFAFCKTDQTLDAAAARFEKAGPLRG
jgi:N-succinyldiaminopimelate aminotransferase